MPSASPIANVALAGSFFIEGTQAESQGPDEMFSGNIYANPQGSGAPIGTYQETSQLVLSDGVPVSATGTATFTFVATSTTGARGKTAQHTITVGSFTTTDTSSVTAISPAGVLTVQSNGTIVAANGVFAGAQGGFTSESQIGLGPTFFLQTSVDYALDKEVAPFAAHAGLTHSVWKSVYLDLAAINSGTVSQPASSAATPSAQTDEPAVSPLTQARQKTAYLAPAPGRVLAPLLGSSFPLPVTRVAVEVEGSVVPSDGSASGAATSTTVANPRVRLPNFDMPLPDGVNVLYSQPYRNRFVVLAFAQFIVSD